MRMGLIRIPEMINVSLSYARQHIDKARSNSEASNNILI